MSKHETPADVGSHEVLGRLPEWDPTLEFSERAIDRFVYSQEPAGDIGDQFRADLAAALAEAVAAERERWQAAAALAADALRELERYEYATATLVLRKAVAALRA